MLRREVRLRKEYLFRKSIEEEKRRKTLKRKKLKEKIEEGKPIGGDLRKRGTAKIRKMMDDIRMEDDHSMSTSHTHIDDEYSMAGVKDPKIIITSSRDPSHRLQLFIKEVCLLLPNTQRINRGSLVVGDLVSLCKKNAVTDIIIVHEHRGKPDGLVVCHLPYGPTAYFSLNDVVLRHDLADKPHNISESNPHLVFHGFSSELGQRVSNILKFLFPPSSLNTKKVVSFTNRDDIIHFRHHSYDDEADTVDPNFADGRRKSGTGDSNEGKSSSPATLSLTELGPRWTMRLYRIELGTIDMKDVEVEWSLKYYFNKPKAALS